MVFGTPWHFKKHNFTNLTMDQIVNPWYNFTVGNIRSFWKPSFKAVFSVVNDDSSSFYISLQSSCPISDDDSGQN